MFAIMINEKGGESKRLEFDKSEVTTVERNKRRATLLVTPAAGSRTKASR